MQAAAAYTSASTAENQKLSVKVKASAPTAELPIMVQPLVVSMFSWSSRSSLNKRVKDQNKKSMVKALAKTDIKLMVKATFSASKAKIEKNAPRIWYSGAPGGWPTSRLLAVVIYSPASQKLTVGSTVSQYVVSATTKTLQPIIWFHLWKLKTRMIEAIKWCCEFSNNSRRGRSGDLSLPVKNLKNFICATQSLL